MDGITAFSVQFKECYIHSEKCLWAVEMKALSLPWMLLK